jgi:2-polyprenyl-3-methyl-5-hydroxy-6-metoxy-1,4-benzoquinol methylase/DNA-binding transcriptional ArsR family regulator
MTVQVEIDQAKLEAFVGKAVGDASGMLAVVLSFLGDRLGLFRELAKGGPATSEELAERAGVDERYAREWLRGLYAAGYLEYERESGRFSLPPEQAQVLAVEGGPFFLGGAYHTLMGELRPIDLLVEAFRSGGGVPQSAYPADTWDGMCRFTRPWFENLLVQEWIPAVPEVKAKLERGARYADVGCGAGLALIKLARAFPRSTFVGYDSFKGQLERARKAAEEAGVTDRVRFELRDAADGLPERYDVVSTYDVVHDAVNPVRLLEGIWRGLEEDGTYLMLEINSADDPAENVGPLATLFYGVSMVYCMTTSLAHGGAGLGTCGCPPSKVRELCRQAGFSRVSRLPLENPFNILYEVKP